MGILDFLGNSVKSVVSGLETAAKKSLPVPTPTVDSTPITKGAFPNRVTPYAPTTSDIKSLVSKPIKAVVQKPAVKEVVSDGQKMYEYSDEPGVQYYSSDLTKDDRQKLNSSDTSQEKTKIPPLISIPGKSFLPGIGSSLDSFFGTNKSIIKPDSELEKTVVQGKTTTEQINTYIQSKANKVFNATKNLASGVEQGVSPTTKVIEGTRYLDERKRDWGDVANLIPNFIAQTHGAGLTVAELATGKSYGEINYPAFNNEKISAQGAQSFYDEEVKNGVPKKQALVSAWLKAGLDIAVIAGLTQSIAKFGFKNLSPESLLKQTNLETGRIREYVATGKPLPDEVQKAFTSLDNKSKADVVRGLMTNFTEPKPSVLGKILGVSEEEAKALYDTVMKKPIVTSETERLPGYRREPGQAPAMGLSTEKVEPVGFHDYKEPSVDINADPNAPKDVKSIISKPINEVVGTAKIGDTTIPINKGGKIAIPEPKTPGIFDEPVSRKTPEKLPTYEGEKDLTTQTLNKLKGRSSVSKTFIENLTNQPDLKQVEREVIREKLKDYPDGSQVPVAEFANKVKAELLPLRRRSAGDAYEPVTLPPDIRGDIDKYESHVYNSNIPTSAGKIHFGEFNEPSKNYFGHTRTEDIITGDSGESDTRRVIEVQSDLYQKGNLENEIKLSKGHSNPEYLQEKAKEMSKLQQYNDPTAHFRIVREEIKKASEDGITKLQFPTGETAMKIEGLGETSNWYKALSNKEISNGLGIGDTAKIKTEDLEVGQEIRNGGVAGQSWVVTDVLGDGKFKAVPKNQLPDWALEDIKNGITDTARVRNLQETFDISGKIDTSNPIYKFYEKDLGRYLKNKYGAELVTDKQGVKWYEVPITKEHLGPVQAFKKPLFSKLPGKKLPLSEITKAIYKDIPQAEVKLIFTDELINGRAIGEYRKDEFRGMNSKLKPIIKLYTENGLASLDTAYHESGHYIFDNFLSDAEKASAIELAKKEIGPLRNASYKLKGYSPDQVAEEYLMDKYAEAKSKGEDYDPKYKSFFDRLDSILKKIVETYKEVTARLKKLYKETGEGGYIKNPLAEDAPEPNIRPITELAPEDASIRNKTSSQELANKQYLKQSAKEIQDSLPKEEVMKIRRKEQEIKATYGAGEKTDEALGQIISEMDVAEKGSRTMVGSGPDAKFIATPSLFPKWVPEDLRSKELFNKVIGQVDSLQTLHYPNRTVSLREARLINEIYNQLDERLSIDTKGLREGITKQYTPEGRLQAKDESATHKLLEKTHKATVREVSAEEKQREHLARVKKAEEESAKNLADEALYQSTLQEKINKAKAEGTKTGGLWNKIQAKLKPIEGLDKTTKDLTKRWLDHKWGIKEIANEEYRRAKPLGPQTFKEVLDYQAGKKTPYIRTAFDDMNTEFKRRGLDFAYLEDYIPQVWTAPEGGFQNVATQYLKGKGMTEEEIKAYLNGKPLENSTALRLKLRPNFVKERFWPDYKTGIEHGLKPKYKSPAELIAYYREQGEQSINNKDYIEALRAEAKLLPADDAPDTWEPVTSRFSRERLYARPELAKMLNGVFRDEDNLDLIPWAVKGISKITKFMFDMRTMAGVPNTTINSFAIGQANRLIYSALGDIVTGDLPALRSDLRASFAFIRANSNNASAKWFSDNQEYLLKMSDNGIGIGRYPGSYETISRKVGDVISSLPKDSSIMEKAGIGFKNTMKGAAYFFDKYVNEKTMRSMMAQIAVQTFKDTYIQGLTKGLTEKEATKFAVDVTKTLNGMIGNVGRSEGTSEGLQAVFTAPYFRESVIGTLFNGGKGWSSQFNNPIYKKSRQFIMGMIIGYGIYNLLNKKLNGDWMWQNPPGHEFDLRIPFPNGDVAYVKYGPSFFAIARNLGSAAINTATGNFDVAEQKIGSLFSTPIELATELWSNRDYFGREIYKATDTGKEKLEKVAVYMGLSVNHPFIQETYNFITGKEPLYQAIIRMAELPLTFGNLTKEATSKYYDALDKKAAARVQAKKPIQKIYDSNQQLKADGKTIEANKVYNALSPSDKYLYDTIKRSEKSKATNARKPVIQEIYNKNQELISEGKTQQANQIYLNLSDDDRHVYDLVKKASKLDF